MLATFGAGVFHPATARASTYYVARTGNNANAGSSSAPFQTIAKGLSVLRAGDTLYIRGGSYSESINSNSQTIPTGSSWSNAPVISAYGSEEVVINGLNLAASYIQYVIFSGLTIDGGGVSFQNGAHHIRLQNGEVRNTNTQGIQGWYVSNIELINLRIHHNGSSDPAQGRLDHGIYIAITNALIEGCDIYENTGFGIQIYDSSGSRADGTIIRNNRIHDNRGDGNVTLSYGNNIQFYNNLVYNGRNGVDVAYGNPTNTQIYNNTIYNHTGGSAIQILGGSNTQIRNNILYQNGATISTYGGSGLTTSNNLTSNPQFVSPSAGDFHLKSGSPAIDAGMKLDVVAADFDNIPRPSGPSYDIGAHEYRATSAGAEPAAATNVRDIQ
jgi:parallel beta-helix repeat protein